MKHTILSFILAMTVFSLSAQSLVGTWRLEPALNYPPCLTRIYYTFGANNDFSLKFVMDYNQEDICSTTHRVLVSGTYKRTGNTITISYNPSSIRKYNDKFEFIGRAKEYVEQHPDKEFDMQTLTISKTFDRSDSALVDKFTSFTPLTIRQLNAQNLRLQIGTRNSFQTFTRVAMQTGSDIINKYKDLPQAMYQDMMPPNYKEAQRNAYETMGREYIPEDVWNAYMEGLKTDEAIVFMPIPKPFDEEKQKELRQELEGLKGYEFVHGVKDDSIPIVSNHPFREVLEVLFPTKSGTTRVYAKTKEEKLLDVMIYGHTPYMDVLKHRAYDISKDVLEKYVACLPAMREAANAQREEAIKARQKADQEDMHNIFMALQAAEDGDCLIVIGGKEHPELKSEEEAREWMEENNIRFQIENVLTGDNLKAKYPQTDKKVVYEFVLPSELKQ